MSASMKCATQHRYRGAEAAIRSMASVLSADNGKDSFVG
jgi:hypothetical protein